MNNIFGISYSRKFPFVHMTLDNLFCLLFEFIVIGFLGFILETMVNYVVYGWITDRGVLCGPFIPIYGVSIVLILLIVRIPKPTWKNFLICFFAIAIGISALELIVGYTIEWTTGAVLWVYDSDVLPLSAKYVSLPVSICWGLLGSVYLMFIIPIIYNFAKKMEKASKIVITVLFGTAFLADLGYTIYRYFANGEYQTLYGFQGGTMFSIFLIGVVVYFALMIKIAMIIYKTVKPYVYKFKQIHSILFGIITLIPLFSAYDYLTRTNDPLIEALATTGFIIAGFFIYFLLIGITLFAIRKLVHRISKNSKVNSPDARVITLVSTLALSIGVCSYGVSAARNPEVTGIDIGTGTNSLNIVALSDLHYGSTGSILNLERMVDEINLLEPDLVLFVGDIIDNYVENLDADYFYAQTSRIESTYGLYAVTGNHEYEKNMYGEVYSFFYDSPITLLLNEEVIIDNKVRLIGRIDYIFGGKSNTRKSIEEIQSDSTLPLIVLDHQPQDYLDAYNANAVLQISGHTHNGQLFPGNLIVGLYNMIFNDGTPTKGLTVVEDYSLYITRGYGTWGFPLRTSGASEILQIDFLY